MRFAKPLTPGGRYLAYVRMVPAEKYEFVGDVYILQDGEIVGLVEAIVFKQWPRVMLNRFFSPPAVNNVSQGPVVSEVVIPLASMETSAKTSKMQSTQPSLFTGDSGLDTGLLTQPSPVPSIEIKQDSPLLNTAASDSVDRAFSIIAEGLGLDILMLTDDANIADFDLGSLMSLVLSQRLREELKTEIRDAFFLEVSPFEDLKKLLG